MRKSLRGLLVLGAAAAVSLGAASFDAEAATITPAHVKVDYKGQKLQIAQAAGTKDTKFYLATTTVTTNKKTEVTTVKTAAAVTEYDATTAGNVTIDLSSFVVTKDNFISVWGNKNTEPILIELPKATTKMKATVDAATSTVRIDNTTDAKNPQDITSTVEYCTVNGSWSDYYVTSGKNTAPVDFTGYAQLGATIRFRVKATATAAALPTAGANIGTDKDGKAITAYVATGNFASNEIKAKIAKTPAGPKATIDYNLRTIKIPATSEYRLTLGNATALASSFTKPTPDTLANGKTATVATLNADDVLKAVTPTIGTAEFDLRTAATEANGKVAAKPASKITEYKLPVIGTTVTVAQSTAAKPTYAAVKATDTVDRAAVSGNGTANQAGYDTPAVKFNTLVYNAKTKVVTGIKLENLLTGATDKYQVAVSDDATLVPAANAKATILNPGKITQVAAKEGQYVFIRKMGDTKTTVWSTPYVLMGKVPAAPAE